jgi:hypothetical protein
MIGILEALKSQIMQDPNVAAAFGLQTIEADGQDGNED